MPARRALAGEAAVAAVAWAPAPCRPLTQGDIHVEVAPGSTAYYMQLAFYNAAQPVAGVEIDGRALRRQGGRCGPCRAHDTKTRVRATSPPLSDSRLLHKCQNVCGCVRRWVWENGGREVAEGGPRQLRVRVVGEDGASVEATLPAMASGSLGVQL
jgi:hypothetical protein